MAKIWGMLSQGDEITITEEMDGLVGEERMELMEEQVQFVRKRKKKKTGFSIIGRIWRNHCGPMSADTEGKSRCGSNHGISNIGDQ